MSTTKLSCILIILIFSSHLSAQTNPESAEFLVRLQADQENKDISIEFLFRIERRDDESIVGSILNGSERIEVPVTDLGEERLAFEVPHYDSELQLTKTGEDRWTGEWQKVRGPNRIATVPASAIRLRHESFLPDEVADPSPFLGRWSVRFESDEDPAVGVFKRSEIHEKIVEGTFLTTTGDYRFLWGYVVDEQLRLSCFDGAHAFHFLAELDGGELNGRFYSGNWWNTSWTATRNEEARLPDAFQQTEWTNAKDLSEFEFPNLDGDLKSLTDEEFSGKCRIIEIFGSWCPNCHDAGNYLTTLQEKYGEDGLSILGLAFELTGDFERDVRQVKRYLKRNGGSYPVLIAGTSDKADATRQFPVLDRVRSYPTFIFLDQANQVRAIYTGFSGPATGQAHADLKASFEAIIESCLEFDQEK